MHRLKEIEFWESHYLEQMTFMLLKDKNKMINALNSKDDIKEDWIKIFNKKSCYIDRGAERIYFWLLNNLGIPNSTPIGSDLLYETSNAFIHIDVKTSSYFFYDKKTQKKKINSGDFKGVVSINHNQGLYQHSNEKGVLLSLNTHTSDQSNRKICLTYIIQLIYNKTNVGKLITYGLLFISIPNSNLRDIYKNDISGGSENRSYKYFYKRNPYFQLLDNQSYRIRILYLSKDFENCEDKLIGFRINK